MRKSICALTLSICASIFLPVAHAEYFGLPNGRNAELSQLADISVEGGYVTGDLSDADYDHFGLRVNFRASPAIMVFGDLGKTDLSVPNRRIGDVDDTPFGIGAFYQLSGFLEQFHTAAKGSYHSGKFTRSGARGNLKITLISVEFLLSPKTPMNSNGMSWYANLGIHRLTSRLTGSFKDTETEPGFGGGIVIPVSAGNVFLGIDYVDEITFGAGFRYDVK